MCNKYSFEQMNEIMLQVWWSNSFYKQPNEILMQLQNGYMMKHNRNLVGNSDQGMEILSMTGVNRNPSRQVKCCCRHNSSQLLEHFARQTQTFYCKFMIYQIYWRFLFFLHSPL